MRKHMDVYYVPGGPGLTSAAVDIFTAWDGSMYAETNMLEACGPDKLVDAGHPFKRVATVGNVRAHSPATIDGRCYWM